MRTKNIQRAIFLVVAMAALIAGLTGLSRVHRRPTAPFKWQDKQGQVCISDLFSSDTDDSFQPGDVLIAIRGERIQSADHAEFLLDRLESGMKVSIQIQREDAFYSFTTTLVPRFNALFVWINVCLGAFFWITGVFVYWKKSEEYAARIFGWMCVVSGVAIIMIWPGRPYGQDWIGYLLPALYFLFYPLIPGLILSFSVNFPAEKRVLQKYKSLQWLLFTPCLIVIFVNEQTYYAAMIFHQAEQYRAFYTSFQWLHILFVVYFLLSLCSLIRSYLHAKSREHRDKVRWIFWGTAMGLTPFIFLWTLPELLGLHPLIPDVVNYLAMMLIPLSVAFSIVRYKVMDIEIVINRSIVYTFVTGIIVVLYLMLAGLVSHFLHVATSRTSHTLTILYTLFAALIFSPLKQRTQIFVDKTFYRVKFNYKLALQNLSQQLMTVHDIQSVVNLILDSIDRAIPVNRIILLGWNEARTGMIALGGHGMSEEEMKQVRLAGDREPLLRLRRDRQALVHEENAESTEAGFLCHDDLNVDRRVELILPLFLQEKLEGVVFLGAKRAGMRFSPDDLALVKQMAAEGFMVLEHLRLQEAMIVEQTEKEKHEALSRLKSEFVSHVSHELRTPLASIEWSIQNLLDGIPEAPSPKIRQYLTGICESSRHLSRMIENLLDITSIEAGKIEMHPESLSVNDEVRQVTESMIPLAEKKQIRLVRKTGHERIVADRDSLRAVCTNLIDNAIKYSPEHSTILIRTDSDGDRVIISVTDEGPGITHEKQKIIFDRFERIREDRQSREKGLGLGLHIVQKLVELQSGRIWLESEPGKGSTFRVSMPQAQS